LKGRKREEMIRPILKYLDIHPLFFITLLFYAIPPMAFFIFIFQQLFITGSDALFWMIFLVSLLPCGLIGGIISIVGILLSRKTRNRLNVMIGTVEAVLGLGGVIAGIFAFALIRAVLG
jgi:hypothetical protein